MIKAFRKRKRGQIPEKRSGNKKSPMGILHFSGYILHLHYSFIKQEKIREETFLLNIVMKAEYTSYREREIYE